MSFSYGANAKSGSFLTQASGLACAPINLVVDAFIVICLTLINVSWLS